MCLLIWKPPGIELPEAHVREGFRRNSDGGGYAYHNPDGEDGKRLMYNKGFFGPAGLEKMVADIKHLTPYGALIHFRIGTHGLKNDANCHPHLLGGNEAMTWVLGHNGVMNFMKCRGSESDTAAFARELTHTLIKSAPQVVLNKDWQEEVSKVIGLGNKLLFLNNHGQHVIINEAQGTTEGGIWYSNTSFRVYTSSTPSTGSRMPMYDDDYDSPSGWDRYKSGTWEDSYIGRKNRDSVVVDQAAPGLSKRARKKLARQQALAKDNKDDNSLLFPIKEPETEKWEFTDSELKQLEAEADAEFALAEELDGDRDKLLEEAVEEAYSSSDFEYLQIDLAKGCTFCGNGLGQKFTAFRDGSTICRKCEHHFRARKSSQTMTTKTS